MGEKLIMHLRNEQTNQPTSPTIHVRLGLRPHQSAASRFAKQYDCMDVSDVHDPNPSSSRSSRGRHARSDSAAGSGFGDANGSNGGSSSRDMVASVGDVKPSIRQFDGKSELRNAASVVYIVFFSGSKI